MFLGRKLQVPGNSSKADFDPRKFRRGELKIRQHSE